MAEDDDKTVDEVFQENEQQDESKDKQTGAESDGDGQDSTNSAPVFENTFTFLDFFKMVGALVFTLALLYFLLKFINTKNRTFGGDRSIQNVGGVGLGSNRSVQLVKVGNRILVVGVGETVNLLKEIESEEEVEQLLAKENTQQGQLIDQTTSLFNKLLKGKGNQDSSANEPSDFKSLMDRQLRQLSEGRKKVHEQIRKKDFDQ